MIFLLLYNEVRNEQQTNAFHFQYISGFFMYRKQILETLDANRIESLFLIISGWFDEKNRLKIGIEY